jgi:hypothetical protein
MGHFRKSSHTDGAEYWEGQHRFEHWYRDNTVYMITARCRGKTKAFASEAAKAAFWDRFAHWTGAYGFVPWVTSLLDNHYHTIGYLYVGANLGEMMRRIHGSVACLANRVNGVKLAPFWVDAGKQGYFDGCIRDVTQCVRAYRYIERQGARHGVVKLGEAYAHTRVRIELERALKRAQELKAFLPMVEYKRYRVRARERWRAMRGGQTGH